MAARGDQDKKSAAVKDLNLIEFDCRCAKTPRRPSKMTGSDESNVSTPWTASLSCTRAESRLDLRVREKYISPKIPNLARSKYFRRPDPSLRRQYY